MRVHFITLPNKAGDIVKVAGPNRYGEYLVKFYVTVKKNGLWLHELGATAYETDLEGACGTALAMCGN